MSRKSWVGYFILGLSLIYAWIDLAIDLIFTALLGLTYAILLVAAGLLFMISIWKRNTAIFFHFISIVAVVIVSGFISNQVLKDMRQESIEKAEVIIKKVEQYKERNGKYPERIGADIGMVDAEMKTGMGIYNTHNYSYQLDDGVFSISFTEPAFMTSVYDSKTKTWVKYD